MHLSKTRKIEPGQIYFLGDPRAPGEGWLPVSLVDVSNIKPPYRSKATKLGDVVLVLSRAGWGRCARSIAEAYNTHYNYFIEVLYEETIYYVHIWYLWPLNEIGKISTINTK